ncbi:unnamed protein product [Ectocarpus sp. CCAP 1310/34]|nr:unnamed protein product [Ectocarpus sp. CCAP 1310/34]
MIEHVFADPPPYSKMPHTSATLCNILSHTFQPRLKQGSMKRAFVLTVVPLVSSASLAAAFVCPAPATATSAAFTPNRPRLAGDASSSSASATIAPLRPARDLHRQQRQRGRHLVASLGGGVPEVAAVVISSTSYVVSWLVGTLVAASIANFLQGRPYSDLGLTPDKILGVPAEEATADHVARLGKAGFMQLFYASQCPVTGDLDGEYRARTLNMGVLHPITAIITHRIWGPGRWLGKGIRTGSREGYNLFASESKGIGLPSDTQRERCFRFSQSSDSVFDRGVSSELDYARAGKNGPLFGGMRDEVRKVNDKLFIGLGYIQAFGGKYNSAPFVMEGPPVGEFSSPDKSL